MSTHETPADIEHARDLAVSDFETRTHETTVHRRNAGVFTMHRPSCAVCGPLTGWLTDYEDAKSAGRRHEADVAHAGVVGVTE